MTIISPYEEPIKIWHNVSLEDSHVVICWNGNNHYSGSTYVEKPFIRLRSIDDKIHVQGRCKKIVPVPVQVKVEPKEEEEGNKKVDTKNKGDIEKNDEKVDAEKIDKDNAKVEKDNKKVEVEKTDEKVDSKKDDKVGKDAQNDGINISWSDVPKLDSNNPDMTSEVMGDGNEEVSCKPPTPDFRSEQSDDEKLNSDSDLNETVLMKTGKDENMSISSMGKSGEENDEKMSVSSAGSPHRLSKDSQ